MDLNKYQMAVVEECRKLVAQGNAAKATFDTTTGQYGISLQAPMVSTIPFLPTWVNKIPREVIPTGTSHQYKRILTLVQTGKATATEGERGGATTITTDNPTVSFGRYTSNVFGVSYQEEVASKGFDPALAKATAFALLQGRKRETAAILGGTISAIGGVGATIAVADESAYTASNFGTATYYVNIKPLTAPAMQKAIAAGATIDVDATAYHYAAGIAASVDLTDNYGLEGTEASGSITATHGVKVTWTPIAKAAGYAIFVGTSSGSANLKCQGVVGNVGYVTLTHLTTTGTACVATDTTVDANAMDGVMALTNASGSGAYIKNIGTALTAASGNGIPEIDTMLSQCFVQSLGMDSGTIVCGLKDRALITRKLGAGTAYSNIRINIDATKDNSFTGGAYVNEYVHPMTGKVVPIETDVNLLAGVIMWIPDSVPYPMANIPAPLKMWLSFDWTNFAYAPTKPTREYENIMSGGLANYIPAAFGLIYNFWAN